MPGNLRDLQSTRQTSDRIRAAKIAQIRCASDRAGMEVVDLHGYLYRADDAGVLSSFDPLGVDSHAQDIFDAMRFIVAGRFLARRIVSPTGASIPAVIGRGRLWRKAVVDFAASHASSRMAPIS